MSIRTFKSKNDDEPWVQLQHKTMLKWLNSKIKDYDQLELPDIPSAPNSIENLQTDLQNGLVLIKLINRLIYDYHNEQNHNSYYYEKLYYLTPIYNNPKFKLQIIENLDDIFKFLQLILKLNICNISSDNLYDGNLKLILGLTWSLYLFNMTSKFNQVSSFMEIKQILLDWLYPISSISNFHKDWIDSVPILTSIFNHYGIELPSTNLTEILTFIHDDLNIPILIDTDDFTADIAPDEKCIVTFCVELYKYFEIDASHQDHILPPSSTPNYDDLGQLIVQSNKFKNKLETKSLRFINRVNTVLNQLSNDYDILQLTKSSIIEKFKISIEKLTQVCRDPNDQGQINDFLQTYNELDIQLIGLINIYQTFHNFKNSIKSQLLYTDYPELHQLHSSLISHLNLIGLSYFPIIKNLSIEVVETKVDKLSQLEGKYLNLAKEINNQFEPMSQVLDSLLADIEGKKLRQASSINRELLFKCLDNFDMLISFFYKIDHFNRSFSLVKSTMDLKKILETESKPSTPLFSSNTSSYASFKLSLSFENNDNLTHFQLSKAFKTLDLSIETAGKLMKLVPLKSVITISPSFSSSTSSFVSTGTSTGSEDEDFIFDDLQQKLDTELSGTRNKVYDLNEFISKLEGGFKL
ncbi:Ca2+-binding actin-bundling protein [Scheffersomyces amazonensis]|uniref:Ca2+-binding actin-bundling protein n=1 Tax=Scheffersomyces amazonensis TaxID=1078765 RepID=UPI00315C6366